jgi:hypothetical protein
MKYFRRMTVVAALSTLLVVPLHGHTKRDHAGGRAEVVSEWNEIMVFTLRTQNPFAQARFAAITQLAVFEAVNAIAGDYKPYLGTIFASRNASTEAAVIAAAHRVLWTYLPDSAVSLDTARANSLARIADGPAKANGIAAGEAAADAMIRHRAGDGSATPMPYTPMTGPGFWQPTPPAFGPAILLHWGKVKPFGLTNGDQFRTNPPPALTSVRYRRDYNEVMEVGGVDSTERPPDRADVARYFAITSAVQAWNPVALQLSADHGMSLSELARTLALLNMAVNDGLIASMDTKYFYNFWRPVTAIRAGDTDGNTRTQPDAAFTPYIATPAFPSFPSAHASAGYAGREVLERMFKRKRHSITLSNPAVPGVILRYSNLEEITDDIDDARVYGGIHFRFDQVAGAWQGRNVGEYVYRHHLRVRPGDKR